MAETREDILNELIQYYDSDDKKTDTSDAQTGSDDMGATRVVEKKSEPKEEILGDTVVVPKLAHEAPAQPDEEHDAEADNDTVSENTVRINTPAKQPEEEFLGNIDIYNDIKKQDESTAATVTAQAKQAPEIKPPEIKRADKFAEPEYSDEIYEDEYDDMNRKGIWFSLKPLWVTLILTAISMGGIWFYLTDNAFVETYKRNFEYNMSILFNSFGVDFDPSSLVPGQETENESSSETETDIGSGPSIDVINSLGEQYTVSDVQTEPETVQTPAQSHAKAERETVTLPFVDAGSSDFSSYDNGVVCAKSNYICRYNSAGKMDWELSTNIANPLISASGKYIAVASEGGTALNLYKDDKLLFNIEIQNTIVSCDVSDQGDIVLVTNRQAYKGAVLVINKRGEEIFSWSSGVNYITSATISSDRVLAVSLVDTANTVNSYVMMFDVSAPQPYAGVELQNTLVFDLFNNNKNIFASGDNSIISMDENCNIVYDKRYDEVYISGMAQDNKGNRMVAFTDNNLPIINVYSARGELDASFVVENKPDIVDIYRSTVLYSYDRDIICGKVNEDEKSVYTAPMTINDVILLNSGAYVIIYANSIEFVKI